jgi:small subunit ribosomal protein S18
MSPPSPAPSAGAPRPGPRRRPGEFGGGGGRKFTPRRKVCQFCVDKIKEVDYKDLARLRRFLSDRAKIEPRRKTGTCARHQRSLNVALKRARLLALLPFTAEHIRVTGVLLREPGAPPWRTPRGPRPVDGEAPAPAIAATDAAAPDGAATPAVAADGAAAPASTPVLEASVEASPEASVEASAESASDTAPAAAPVADATPAEA